MKKIYVTFYNSNKCYTLKPNKDKIKHLLMNANNNSIFDVHGIKCELGWLIFKNVDVIKFWVGGYTGPSKLFYSLLKN